VAAPHVRCVPLNRHRCGYSSRSIARCGMPASSKISPKGRKPFLR
jgi:hypothetical protein